MKRTTGVRRQKRYPWRTIPFPVATPAGSFFHCTAIPPSPPSPFLQTHGGHFGEAALHLLEWSSKSGPTSPSRRRSKRATNEQKTSRMFSKLHTGIYLMSFALSGGGGCLLQSIHPEQGGTAMIFNSHRIFRRSCTHTNES